MDAIELTFHFDNPASAADFLAKLNGYEVPSNAAEPDSPPWEDDEIDAAESERKASADPWAEDAKATKAAKPQASPKVDSAVGVLFPASGTYERETPNGNRTWEFGKPGAPECDCGYPAALVTGRKAGAKRDWHAYWCPVGFNKEKYRDKCGFSEFA